jgi:hypothetical protein
VSETCGKGASNRTGPRSDEDEEEIPAGEKHWWVVVVLHHLPHNLNESLLV